MKTTAALATVLGLGMVLASPAQAWISFLDFNDSMYPPEPPWIGSFNDEVFPAHFIDVGGGNMALRMESPDHSAEDPDPGTYYNEYYAIDIPGYEKVGATRFRLNSFTSTGKENLLAISTPVAAPTITLVDGNYWIWSNLSEAANQPILDLGPATAGQWHEVYIQATVTAVDEMGTPTAGGARVWWDGQIVFDGPVDGGGDVNLGGYVEFGSGTYWQVNAGTVVDFDWVGFGDVNDFPVPPGVDGDYNGNGVVDAADYTLWRDGIAPLQNEVAAPLGTTDAADYDAWRERFGDTNLESAATPIPEPTAVASALIALAAARRKWQCVSFV